MNKTILYIVTVILLANLSLGSQVAADQFASAADHVGGDPRFHKSGLRSKADSSLAEALAEYAAHTDKGKSTPFKPSSKFLRVAFGRIVIDARAAVDGERLLNDLIQLGLTNGSQYGDVVSGQLPLAAIEDALALPSLRSITASPRPINHAGSITSQGDSALRADVGRTSFAVDGTGVTVAVISDSYDTLGGAGTDISTGDLPAGGVPVLNGESTLCGVLIFCIDEGRAMLQIIHDVAPGAGLLFQSGIDGIASYASAIANLAAAGADVIVDDLLIINEPMFQDGIIAQAIDAAVADGVSYFSAAGNSGRKSYEAAFDDSGEIFCIEFFEPIGDCDPMFERVGRMHDFDPGPGVDNYQSITVPVNAVMTIAMQWDQPFGGSGPETDHDIVLLDGTGQTYVEISANDNIIMGEGWEALQFNNSEFLDYGTDFSIMLTYDDVDSVGPPASLVKLVIFGEGITINEHVTNSSALYGHPNAAGAEAVGAAFFMDTPENGTSPPVLQPYSSAGGTPILFDTDGTPLAVPEIRQKPEITAVDGVNTTFFFDDSYGNDGIDDFFGTSAAAPHAAAVAALVLQARPGATPDQIYTVLESTALDMGAPGIDYDSGYGLIQADAAIAAANTAIALTLSGVVALPDINSNGSPDVGVAMPGSTRIVIRDGATDALISDISFGEDDSYDIAVLSDLDSSGAPEIALLNQQDSGQVRVQIRDSVSGNVVSNLWYGLQYAPVSMAVVSDYDGSGFPEVAVLGSEPGTDAIRVQVRDAASNNFVDNVFLGNQTVAEDVVSLADSSGNAVPEIGILSTVKGSDQIRLQVRDSDTSALQQNVWFGKVYETVRLITLPDINGNGADEVVALGLDTAAQLVRVQIRDSASAATLGNIWLDATNAPVDLAVVNDTNGNGFPEIAILVREPTGNGRVRIQDSVTGAFIRNLFYYSLTDPVGLAVLPDYNSNGFEELAVLGESAGLRHVQILDTSSGNQVNRIDFP